MHPGAWPGRPHNSDRRAALDTMAVFLNEHPGWSRSEGGCPLEFSNKQLLLLHTAALGRPGSAILDGSGGPGWGSQVAQRL